MIAIVVIRVARPSDGNLFQTGAALGGASTAPSDKKVMCPTSLYAEDELFDYRW